jgi:hypothetical protein
MHIVTAINAAVLPGSCRDSEDLKIKFKALMNVRKPTAIQFFQQKITKSVRNDESIQLHMRQDVREFVN